MKIFSICADQKGWKNNLKFSTQIIEKKVKKKKRRSSKFKLVESCKGRKHNQKEQKVAKKINSLLKEHTMFFRVVIELWKYNIHNFLFYIHTNVIFLFRFYDCGIILTTWFGWMIQRELNKRLLDEHFFMDYWETKATFEGDIMNVSAWLFVWRDILKWLFHPKKKKKLPIK